MAGQTVSNLVFGRVVDKLNRPLSRLIVQVFRHVSDKITHCINNVLHSPGHVKLYAAFFEFYHCIRSVHKNYREG